MVIIFPTALKMGELSMGKRLQIKKKKKLGTTNKKLNKLMLLLAFPSRNFQGGSVMYILLIEKGL